MRFSMFLSILLVSCGGTSAPGPDSTKSLPGDTPLGTELEYIGAGTCGDCHPDEANSWQGSHHDLAMEEASDESVLGDFNNTSFSYSGVNSVFSRREGEFWVRTDGPDGELADFKVSYTFGVDPLQQYLIEFPDGRLQALSISWDTRPRSEGGQRWFHLYPNEEIDFQDPLHWTGRQQNWNFMCSECHSTNLKRKFDPSENRFNTTWSELDVSCEACHGPASRHLNWVEEKGEEPDSGFPISLIRDVTWVFNEGETIAQQEIPTSNSPELNVCSQCHSRRGLIHESHPHGDSLLQTHRPALLDEGIYFPDGQIQDEVYVWGSFLQSKMHKAGVTCTDCHDPHSLQVFGGSDQICSVCHESEQYYSEKHHFHPQESPGARCINCHMPERDYMVVDPRRDHSFRIPRPDLSASLGVPNACNNCHDNQDSEWATAQINDRLGGWSPDPHYGQVLQAGRVDGPGARQALSALAADPEQTVMVRATALTNYAGPARAEQLTAIETGLEDPDPLLRWAATRAANAATPEVQIHLLAPRLNDSVRLIRKEAALALAPVPANRLNIQQRQALQSGLVEYRESQRLSGDRPESHLNLGVLATRLQQFQQAEIHYRAAFNIDPQFVPSIINLADLLRLQQRESEGEQLLRLGLSRVPESASLNHALGLLLVRTDRSSQALSFFRRAAELRPEAPRFSYVHAVALQSAGRLDESLRILRQSLARHSYDREILMALVTINRDLGRAPEAIGFLQRLIELEPAQSQLKRLLRQLEASK